MLFLLALALVVFICEIVADFAWASYMLEVGRRRPYHAGMWSGMIQLIGAVTIIGYVEYKWLIVPAILGSFVGTAFAVARGKDSDA